MKDSSGKRPDFECSSKYYIESKLSVGPEGRRFLLPFLQLLICLLVLALYRPAASQALDRQIYYDPEDGNGPQLALTEGGDAPLKSTYYTQNFPNGLDFLEAHYAALGQAYSCLKDKFGWNYEDYFANNDNEGNPILGSVVLPPDTNFHEAGNTHLNDLELVFVSLFGNYGSSSDSHLAADPELVAHEIAHYALLASSILDSSEEARAMAESFADIIALICHDAESGDWQIGDFAYSPNVRDLANPSRSGWQIYPPSHMTEFDHGKGRQHGNSLIFSKAIYLWMMGGSFRGIDVSGVGVDRVYQLFFDAMRDLSRDATFEQGYERLKSGVISEFTDLEEQAEIYNSLNAAFAAVGVASLNPTLLPWIDLGERVEAIDGNTVELTLVVSEAGTPEKVELYFSTQSVGVGCNSSWIGQATEIDLPDLFSWSGDSSHLVQVGNLQPSTDYGFCLRQKAYSGSEWDYTEVASVRTWPLNPHHIRVAPGGNIQNAIDAAAPGAVISIAPGYYYQSINLRGKQLTILGEKNISLNIPLPVLRLPPRATLLFNGSAIQKQPLPTNRINKICFAGLKVGWLEK